MALPLFMPLYAKHCSMKVTYKAVEKKKNLSEHKRFMEQ
jgi:hypothetical protein